MHEPKMTKNDIDVYTQIEAPPGSILIFHPKGDSKFSEEYVKFLCESLPEIMPPNTRAMIVSDNLTFFTLINPAEDGDDYVRGWNDAVCEFSRLNA